MDPAKIMIVEDNTTVAEDARECLEGLGYGVTAIVATGEEAVEAAGRDRPDAVLMDIKLRGDMDGIEAADRIHDQFDIPVLFLSAYSDRELLGRAKRTGSFGYLVKPFEERELYAMMEMTLYKARAEAERREMESRLARERKMAAIGRMAAGVAHHFNNMLYAAIGNLEMAREDLPPESDAGHHLFEAETATRRAADMSRLLLTYLGQGRGTFQPLDLSEAVGKALREIQGEIPSGAPLEADLPETGPAVSADGAQLAQLLRALVTNAREAVGADPSGRVTVSVETAAAPTIPETHRLPLDWEAGEGPYTCLAVADTGKGMDGETIDAAFDPFFTDKFTGRGLGLPVVLGIVKAHGGCVTVESRPGAGSTFRVFLPITAEPVTPAAGKANAAPDPIPKGGAVLLVEDQDLVRRMTRLMLRQLGFEVLSAADGKGAVEIFREESDRIRLVLCDLSMPGMDGWETLAALRRIRPDLPAILTSGYDRSQALAGAHAEQPQAFLQKPYQRAALKGAIERVLG